MINNSKICARRVQSAPLISDTDYIINLREVETTMNKKEGFCIGWTLPAPQSVG